MGMSGAYGGTGGQGWDQARDLASDLPAPSSGDGSSGDSSSDEPDSIVDLWSAIADALIDENPDLQQPQPPATAYPIADLLPRRIPSIGRSSPDSSGSGGGGAIRGGSGPAGRSGSGSRRSVARGGARGGVALGAGYALRRGDAADLAEVGLDLDELRTLSPIRQRARILDAVLGEGAHPDEYALRKAASRALKEILQAEEPPSELAALEGFVANYIFELALVELKSQLDAGLLDPSQSVAQENRIRRWASKRVKLAKIATEGHLSISRFKSLAARLTGEALRILRAGRATT